MWLIVGKTGKLLEQCYRFKFRILERGIGDQSSHRGR
jgi:hypothetical protein